MDLHEKRCLACEGLTQALDQKKIDALIAELKDWTLEKNNTWISRTFRFKNFYHTMAFVNTVAWIANQENHHPDLEIGYGQCKVNYQTHAVSGLTDNDFICAAKIDQLI